MNHNLDIKAHKNQLLILYKKIDYSLNHKDVINLRNLAEYKDITIKILNEFKYIQKNKKCFLSITKEVIVITKTYEKIYNEHKFTRQNYKNLCIEALKSIENICIYLNLVDK